MDKQLGAARKARWNIAFAEGSNLELYPEKETLTEKEDRNRKATIVIEHLIQASDISHTVSIASFGWTWRACSMARQPHTMCS